MNYETPRETNVQLFFLPPDSVFYKSFMTVSQEFLFIFTFLQLNFLSVTVNSTCFAVFQTYFSFIFGYQ